MSKLFNTAFEIILSITILVSIVVGVSYTLDKLSDSLILLWEICLTVSFIFLLIFYSAKNKNKHL